MIDAFLLIKKVVTDTKKTHVKCEYNISVRAETKINKYINCNKNNYLYRRYGYKLKYSKIIMRMIR